MPGKPLIDLNPFLVYWPDDRPVQLFFTSLTIPRWSFFLIFVIALCTLVFCLSGRMISLFLGLTRTACPSTLMRRLTFSTWVCISIITVWIWITTWIVEPHVLGRILRIAAILVTLPLIFLLEGLGAALAELKDKEIPRNAHGRGRIVRILGDFQNRLEPYLRAREWLMAALTIFLTVVVEFEGAQVPFFGRLDGTLVRILFTVMLATIAVIWIAQTPGKELGRSNPLPLLVKRITWPVHQLVLFTREKAETLCINDPSDMALRAIHWVLNIPEPAEGDSLPPGGDLVFTELVHRYGYSDCDVVEIYDIDDEGASTFTQTQLVYVDPALCSYRRKFISDVAFHKDVEIVYSVFRIPKLGVNIRHDLEKWRKIATEGSSLSKELFPIHKSWEDESSKATTDPEHRKASVVDIDWNPEDIRPRLIAGEALLIKISATGQMPIGGFKAPGSSMDRMDKLKRDHWSRKLAKPCYEASTQFRFASKNSKKAIFVSPEYFAEQDKKHQALESDRFSNEQNADADLNTLTVRLTRGLPGCSYIVEWFLQTL